VEGFPGLTGKRRILIGRARALAKLNIDPSGHAGNRNSDAVSPSWSFRPLKISNFKNPRWRRPTP